MTNTADNTTQAQRQALSGASDLGHAEHRRSRLVSPVSSAERYAKRSDGRHGHTLPPLQLPPLQTSPARHDAGYIGKRVEISGLLSSSPPEWQPLDRRSQSHPYDYQQPSHSLEATLREHRPWVQHDHSSVSTRHYAIPRQRVASSPSKRSQPTSDRNSTAVSWQSHVHGRDSELSPSAHSPTNTTGSFVSNHPSGSSNQSPSVPNATFHASGPPSLVSLPPPELNYQLSIRQQPIAARACGYGERDRRVIDPPPILQLKITDKETSVPEQDEGAMLAVHCTLLSTDGDDDQAAAVDTSFIDAPPARCLMGTLVASPYQAKDENGIAGTFFVFSDLSCRKPGTYKLEFKMLRVDPLQMRPGSKVGVVATIESQTFTVYQAKDFPGMRASTALLTALREQGLAVGLKKGTEARISKGRKRQQSESSVESGGSEGESGGSPGSHESGKKSSGEKTTPRRKVKNKSKT